MHVTTIWKNFPQKNEQTYTRHVATVHSVAAKASTVFTEVLIA